MTMKQQNSKQVSYSRTQNYFVLIEYIYKQCFHLYLKEYISLRFFSEILLCPLSDVTGIHLHLLIEQNEKNYIERKSK